VTDDEIKASLAALNRASMLTAKPHDHVALAASDVERAAGAHKAAVEDWIERHDGYRHVEQGTEWTAASGRTFETPSVKFWFIPRAALD
jgi:hypothetical protein